MGLEKIVENRLSNKSLGITAEIKSSKEKEEEGHTSLKKLQPEDLSRFGLIPEFIGRLPVISVLDQLEKEALVEILVKPKNALIKQYQKLFSYENVELKFTDEALTEIAKQALDRKTGARGLRGVIESAMLDIMYEIPSKQNVKECIIDDKVIRGEAEPKLIFGTPSQKPPESKDKDKGAGSAESA